MGRDDLSEQSIGISEDGEEAIPDGATRGWECPGGEGEWKPRLPPVFTDDTGLSYYRRPLPLFDQFIEIARAAWNRRSKGI